MVVFVSHGGSSADTSAMQTRWWKTSPLALLRKHSLSQLVEFQRKPQVMPCCESTSLRFRRENPYRCTLTCVQQGSVNARITYYSAAIESHSFRTLPKSHLVWLVALNNPIATLWRRRTNHVTLKRVAYPFIRVVTGTKDVKRGAFQRQGRENRTTGSTYIQWRKCQSVSLKKEDGASFFFEI